MDGSEQFGMGEGEIEDVSEEASTSIEEADFNNNLALAGLLFDEEELAFATKTSSRSPSSPEDEESESAADNLRGFFFDP